MIRQRNNPDLHLYLLAFEPDNFDEVCRIALREDKSVAVVMNEIIKYYIANRRPAKSRVHNGSCQMSQ